MVTIETLKENLPELCKKYQIAYVDAFGSVARSEQNSESDIDLIIEFSEPRKKDISSRFFGFLHELEDTYNQKVDLLTEQSLKNPYLKKEIDKSRIRIYEN